MCLQAEQLLYGAHTYKHIIIAPKCHWGKLNTKIIYSHSSTKIQAVNATYMMLLSKKPKLFIPLRPGKNETLDLCQKTPKLSMSQEAILF